MFGVIHRLIYRLHEYPVALNGLTYKGLEVEGEEDLEEEQDHKRQQQKQQKPVEQQEDEDVGCCSNDDDNNVLNHSNEAMEIASFMDGQRCDDELSCIFQWPMSMLKQIVVNEAKKEVILQ